jgi:hypothetical protein
MLADDPPPTAVGPRDNINAHGFSDCHASLGNVTVGGPWFQFSTGQTNSLVPSEELRDQHNRLENRYQCVSLILCGSLGRGVYVTVHCPLSSAEVKNACGFASTSHITCTNAGKT